MNRKPRLIAGVFDLCVQHKYNVMITMVYAFAKA